MASENDNRWDFEGLMSFNQEKIDILMATYNGEKYIREQIESLQNQSYNNWTLLISDDGSTDNTLAIVEEMPVFILQLRTFYLS